MQQQVMQWLAQRKADGVNLSVSELLYYQGKTALLDLHPKGRIQAKLAGSYLAKTKGRGMEFDEVRHYQAGDDIRAIDWRVTARTGKPHTKLYREEKERPVFVLTDLGESMHFGTQFLYKSVQAAHLTALIAWAARARGDRIGGLIFNHSQHLEFKPMTRHQAVLSLLHGLLELHRAAPGQDRLSLDDALLRLRRLARPGSLIFLISDFVSITDATRGHLSSLSRHCELVAYPISDPFEQALPSVRAVQQVKLTDGQSVCSLLLGDKQTDASYQARYQQHQQRLERLLKHCRAQVMPISCALPLELQLGGRT